MNYYQGSRARQPKQDRGRPGPLSCLPTANKNHRSLTDHPAAGKQDDTLQKTLKLVAISLALAAGQAWAHGNVTPQAVVPRAQRSGRWWLVTNPYREPSEYDTAVTIGASAYNQNCAACHGLDGISGASTPTCGTWRPATTGMVQGSSTGRARRPGVYAEDGDLVRKPMGDPPG